MTREGAAAETEEERGEKESPAKGDVSPANNVFLMSFDSSSEAGRYQAPCMSSFILGEVAYCCGISETI